MKTSLDNYDFNRKSESGLAGFEVLFNPNSNKYFFHFNDEEGKALLYSQSYTTEKGRDNGIKSLSTNLLNSSRYEVKTDKKFYFVIRAGNHQEIARSRFFSDKEKMLDAMDFAKTFYAGEESEEISTSKAMLKSSKIKKEEVPVSKHPFRIDIYTAGNGDEIKGKIEHMLTKEKMTFSNLNPNELLQFMYSQIEQAKVTKKLPKETIEFIKTHAPDILAEEDSFADFEHQGNEENLEPEVPLEIETLSLEDHMVASPRPSPSDPFLFHEEDVSMKIIQGGNEVKSGINRADLSPTNITLALNPLLANNEIRIEAHYNIKSLITGKIIFGSNFTRDLSHQTEVVIPVDFSGVQNGTYSVNVFATIGKNYGSLPFGVVMRKSQILKIYQFNKVSTKKLVASF